MRRMVGLVKARTNSQSPAERPGLEDVVRQLAPEGPRHIRLAPLMLVAGEHARSDMAGEWKGRLEAAGHTVQCVEQVGGLYRRPADASGTKLLQCLRQAGHLLPPFGLGLKFEGDHMNFSALPWTPSELENAAHPHELPAVHHTVIRASVRVVSTVPSANTRKDRLQETAGVVGSW